VEEAAGGLPRFRRIDRLAELPGVLPLL
jgi:hypothetical protein